MQEVIFKVSNMMGEIILNRPEKINSLTHNMIIKIDEKLKEWEKDDRIRFVLMYGSGDRGFCAGGDMRVYYDNKDRAKELAKEFFPSEYNLDLKIIKYPKPIIAFLDGIVMGGGVGISYGSKYKIVTEKTKWSMPEVNIGFFPDVGASFFLNQIPQEMARYISLSAKFLNADDVCYLGYADYKIAREDFTKIKEVLKESEEDSFTEMIEKILAEYSVRPGKSSLEKDELKIERYFSGTSISDIFKDLKKGKDEGDQWAEENLNILREKSVFSQMIILEQLERAKNFTVEECFELEMILSLNFMENIDFFEGLRSILIDKDQPNWNYKNPEDIERQEILKYFNKK